MKTGIYASNNKTMIFYIDLPKEGRQFMSANKQKDLQSVAFVNAKDFLDLWKNDPKKSHGHLAYGDPKTWRSDYKYKKATDGFSHGLVNPVPLASVYCGLNSNGEPYAEFLNGITRTIWLLSNNAECFPISTDSQSSALFNKYAGIGLPIVQLSRGQE